jgi:archaellum biogenesis ATPase FlaH
MKRNILYAVLQLKLAQTLQKSTVLLTDNISFCRIRDVFCYILNYSEFLKQLQDLKNVVILIRKQEKTIIYFRFTFKKEFLARKNKLERLLFQRHSLMIMPGKLFHG